MGMSPAGNIDRLLLQKLLDKAKSKVFLGSNNAFLSSLMCSMDFVWTRDVPTAATNGEIIWWNPDWFIKIPEDTRVSVLLHEIWHVGKLHMIRGKDKNKKVWNFACDYRINNDGVNEKPKPWSFVGTEPLINHDFDRHGRMAEEDIYKLLMQNPDQVPDDADLGDDMKEADNEPGDPNKIIGNVVRAIHQSEMAGQAGKLPGDIKSQIKGFLDPVVPWEQTLRKFFEDLIQEDYSWRRPNRRHSEIYLPTRFTDDGRLQHLAYYLDISGSISDKDIERFNSEVRYIWNNLKPEKLTVVTFDTNIQNEYVFNDGDVFDELEITGRGGTCLVCVHDHIERHQPTAAIIFSDLHVWPMEPLSTDLPVIWICIANPGAEVPFGELLHID